MQSELNVEEVVNDRSWKVGNNVGSCRELSKQGAARGGTKVQADSENREPSRLRVGNVNFCVGAQRLYKQPEDFVILWIS